MILTINTLKLLLAMPFNSKIESFLLWQISSAPLRYGGLTSCVAEIPGLTTREYDPGKQTNVKTKTKNKQRNKQRNKQGNKQTNKETNKEKERK